MEKPEKWTWEEYLETYPVCPKPYELMQWHAFNANGEYIDWLENRNKELEHYESDEYMMLVNKQLKTIDKLYKTIDTLREALEFYAEAKILFISKDGEMPPEKIPGMGVTAGFDESPVHIKDDGSVAKKGLKEVFGEGDG